MLAGAAVVTTSPRTIGQGPLVMTFPPSETFDLSLQHFPKVGLINFVDLGALMPFQHQSQRCLVFGQLVRSIPLIVREVQQHRVCRLQIIHPAATS